MKADSRTLSRTAARLALPLMLAAAGAAHGQRLQPFGSAPLDQQSTNPVYLRYDYAYHKRSYHSLDTDNRLVATYNGMGVLLEQAASSPQPLSGKLWMNRAAFVVGARDTDGNSLNLGIGQTVLYGAQKDRIASLVLLASSAISPTSALELNFGIPASAITHALALRPGTLREADGEAALDFKTNHAALRMGYRTFAVRDAASTAGWFVGLSLFM